MFIYYCYLIIYYLYADVFNFLIIYNANGEKKKKKVINVF